MKKFSKNIEVYKKSDKYPQWTRYRIKNAKGFMEAANLKIDGRNIIEILITDEENPHLYNMIIEQRGYFILYRWGQNKKPQKININELDYDNMFIGFDIWDGPYIGSPEWERDVKQQHIKVKL